MITRPQKNIISRTLESIDLSSWGEQWGSGLMKNPTDLQLHILRGRHVGTYGDNPEKAYKTVFNTLNLLDKNYSDVRGNRSDIGGITKAAKRIIEAISNGEHIALATDFDVDGTSSAALMREAFTRHFGVDESLIHVFISHRMKEGYGFTNSVVDRIMLSDNIPTLVITADQGSSNATTVDYYAEQMAARGLHGDVIITDHHEIPEAGGPDNAFAFINPSDKRFKWEDHTICGAGVAYLLMEEVAEQLAGSEEVDFQMDKLLGFTAAATVADCVSLASPINRYFFKRGISQIDRGVRPAWRQMRTLNRDPATPIDNAESIGFGLGPRINACSRMGMDGNLAVDFFTARRDDEAAVMLSELDINNDGRKQIERDMQEKAMLEAEKQYLAGKKTIVVYLPDGQHGIHGIVASRIVEAFGRPTIMISPKDEAAGTVSGSARSISGFNLAEVLETIREEQGLLIGSGGHMMAAGMQLYKKDIEAFSNAFEELGSEILGDRDLRPQVFTDGSLLDFGEISLDTFDEVNELEPFGVGFEKPAFLDDFTVDAIKSMGDGTHFRIELTDVKGNSHKAVWFRAVDNAGDSLGIEVGDSISMLYQLSANWWNGKRSLQLMVVAIEK